MIEAKIGKDVNCEVKVGGTVLDLAADVLNLITALYLDIRSQNPAECRLFQAVLMACVSDPRNPVWGGTEAVAENPDNEPEE